MVAYVEPGSEHPDAVLIDLKSFDIDPGEKERCCCDDG